MLNRIVIMGRLTRDPELRRTQNGTAVTSFSAVVEGRLQIRDWKDKDGNNRRSAEVVADNIYFGDSKRDSQSGGDYAPPAYGSPAESYTAPASGGFAEIEEDGELPF